MTTAARPIATRSDHQLVGAVRAGDDRAFEELFHRYRRRITAYVYGMVSDHARAEDITQEVFVSALRRMRETERPIAFRPWIYEIAKNACIDAFRRRSRAEEVSLNTDDGGYGGDHLRLVSSEPAPDAAVETKQRLDHLCGAFGGLSEAHHQILVLRELEGLSYREIGERMGLSRPAVESTLFRARRRLGEEYDELVSGARCERVQSIISSAAAGDLGSRDQRRMARHVAHCQSCRRHARSLGVAAPAAEARGARRLAGLLPLPLLGRSISNVLGPAADPIATTFGKAAATVATLAIAGFGAGSVAEHGGTTLRNGGGHAHVQRLSAPISEATLAASVGVRDTGVPGVASKVAQASTPAPGARGGAGQAVTPGGTPAGPQENGEGNARAGGGERDAAGPGAPVESAHGDATAPAGSDTPSTSLPTPRAPETPSAPATPSTPSAPTTPSAPEQKAPKVELPKVSAPSTPPPSAPQAPQQNPPAAPTAPAASAPDVKSSVSKAASTDTSAVTAGLPNLP